jgi:hypothetical protein
MFELTCRRRGVEGPHFGHNAAIAYIITSAIAAFAIASVAI